MEKKTIGDFIATLRKANGMTQKELAERLNVSDKSISRWERNESAPDLSLIPVIAEIFNISCDELLRGERKPVSERTDATIDNETASPKAEKQRLRLLKASLSSYKTKTSIAMSISIVGIIIALICNFVATQALLGFLIGVIFFAISIICQKIFVNKAFLCVEDSELDEIHLHNYKKTVYKQAEISVGLTVFFLGFTFPLAFVDPYYGIVPETFIAVGSACAIIFLIMYAITIHFINYIFKQKHLDLLTEKQLIVYNHNKRLKQKCFSLTVVLLIITFLIQIFGSLKIWNEHNITSNFGIVFEDYDTFVAYMEQDIPRVNSNTELNAVYQAIIDDESTIDQSEKDNFLDELNRVTIIDDNDNIICTFIWRNKNVYSYNYTTTEDGILPITVITYDDYSTVSNICSIINWIYATLYPIEIISILVYYSKKKMK